MNSFKPSSQELHTSVNAAYEASMLDGTNQQAVINMMKAVVAAVDAVHAEDAANQKGVSESTDAIEQPAANHYSTEPEADAKLAAVIKMPVTAQVSPIEAARRAAEAAYETAA